MVHDLEHASRGEQALGERLFSLRILREHLRILIVKLIVLVLLEVVSLVSSLLEPLLLGLFLVVVNLEELVVADFVTGQKVVKLV